MDFVQQWPQSVKVTEWYLVYCTICHFWLICCLSSHILHFSLFGKSTCCYMLTRMWSIPLCEFSIAQGLLDIHLQWKFSGILKRTQTPYVPRSCFSCVLLVPSPINSNENYTHCSVQWCVCLLKTLSFWKTIHNQHLERRRHWIKGKYVMSPSRFGSILGVFFPVELECICFPIAHTFGALTSFPGLTNKGSKMTAS